MKLVNLHWLLQIGLPNDFVEPDPSDASNREERNRLIQERYKTKRAFQLKYAKAYYASKLKASDAGEKVPHYWQYPFGSFSEMEAIIRKDHPTLPLNPSTPDPKGWSSSPPLIRVPRE